MPQIRIQIHPNGLVRAETAGVTGKACLDYIKVIEELLGAKVVDSEFKPEYFEKVTEQQQVTVLDVPIRQSNQG